MKIHEAIREVMRRKGKPMTAKEAYKEIERLNLFEFNTPNPAHIVNTQIRRHCKGIPDRKSYSRTKYFEAVGLINIFIWKPQKKSKSMID